MGAESGVPPCPARVTPCLCTCAWLAADALPNLAPARAPPLPQVISSTEDVPSRYFNAWYAAFVPSSSTAEAMDPLDAFGWVGLGAGGRGC